MKKIIFSLIIGILLIGGVIALTMEQTVTVTVLSGNVLDIFSPLNGDIYNSRRVLINLSLGNEAEKVKYSDNDRGFRTLCTNCDEYSRTKSFVEGNHTLDILAIFDGEEINKTRTFFIDSRDPQISRTYPRRNAYTNGSGFYIKFKEENVKEFSIDYNPTIPLSVEDCDESRGYRECYFDLNLEDKDGKEIEYKFIIKDIADNIKESRLTKINVDTKAPNINNPDDMVEKIYRYYAYLKINITELNLEKVEYFDLNEDPRRQRWRRACTRLKKEDRESDTGLCEKRVRFKGEEPNLLIRVTDKAGNSEVVEIVPVV